MNDILLFGGGYQGSKRVTRYQNGFADFPSHPVQGAGINEIQNITLSFEISKFWSYVDGRDYLIGVHEVNPTDEEKLDAIFKKRPNPLPLE